VAATPVTALIAKTYVAETVVNAAIVADMPAPIAAIKSVAVVVEAPVAGGPQRALVGSLNPRARHPEKPLRSPGPIAGRPDEVIPGSGRLIVIEQGRRRLGRVRYRLLPIARIV
jgi:hypothetical protein